MDNYGDANTNYNANSDQPKGPIASLSRLTFQDFQNFFSKPYVIVRLFCLVSVKFHRYNFQMNTFQHFLVLL